jgi:hypothetical protein
MSRNPLGRRESTRNAVETGIDLAKHLGNQSWEQAAAKGSRSVRLWPDPELKPGRPSDQERASRT